MNETPRIHCDADPHAITIDEARLRIKNAIEFSTGMESVPVESALGRVSATDISSPMSVPSFRASAMDGFAVRTADCTSPLTLAGQSFAGHPGVDAIAPFSCQRITTGARVPDEADAVVQQENVTIQGDLITINQLPVKGLHIREPGSDSRLGAQLIASAARIGSAELALLAAHGITHVEVKRRLEIALFSTGDELKQPGQSLNNGQIFDANRPLISALLTSSAVNIVDLGICADSRQSLEDTFATAASADLVISSGGVSVGDADHVRSVLQSHGSVDLWKIAMKPGRPLTFGSYRTGQPYFGLPGNPVSAAITCLLFVKPAIDHMLGISKPLPPPLQLPLVGELTKNPGRVEYQRAVMTVDHNGVWQVGTTGQQDSHVLSSLHHANCLIELPVESNGARNGERVNVYPFTHFYYQQL